MQNKTHVATQTHDLLSQLARFGHARVRPAFGDRMDGVVVHGSEVTPPATCSHAEATR